MDNAQAIFREWAKGTLAPMLRGLGFKGSGQTFTLPHDECWVLLGVQKSRSSTADEVKFTFNLSVANRKLWSELREWEHYWLAKRPSANGLSPGQTLRRVGNLLPDRLDKWWSISSGSSPDDIARVSAEIETALRDFGIPALRRMIEDNEDGRIQHRLDSIRRIRPRPAHLK